MSLLLYKLFNSLAQFFFKAAGLSKTETVDTTALIRELEAKNSRIEALRNEIYSLSSKLTTANNLIKGIANRSIKPKATTKTKNDPDDLI